MDSPACANVDSASCAENEPAFEIARVGRINLPHSAVHFAQFKNFRARGRRKRGRARPKRAACALRHKQPQSHDGAVPAAIPDPIEPENPEREHPVYCRGAFARRGGEQRPLARILMHAAAHIESGKGVFEIGRGGERFNGGVGKRFGENSLQSWREIVRVRCGRESAGNPCE